MEKRNFVNKIIPRLETGEETITDQGKILKETKNFYENLYKDNHDLTDVNLDLELRDFDVPKLSDQEKDSLEGLITYPEATNFLRNMNNDRSPGSDGFSAEFFKFFWKKIGTSVVRSLNYGFQEGKLTVTQREGIITCIPKEGKPKQFLKNWRPITLLNTVYKIASGVISTRIKSVLNKLISKDQTGFLKGRYIGENTRDIYDIMDFTEEYDIPGLLLFIDFEKAFDSVSWNFLYKVLNFFNFGPGVIDWVKTFYNDISSRINIGGHLSDIFLPKRGYRQGDPISPYLFLLCAEILAIKIRNNKQIKGIIIDRYEYKVSQYADDTSLILDGSEQSLNASLNELKWFERISGLKVNFDKTQVIWIGSRKYSRRKLCQNWDLIWGKTSFKLLGIEFDVDLSRICEINFRKNIAASTKTLKQWEKRLLSPVGRITVIKTLIISRFNHLFISLPNPSNNIINELNEMVFNFLWQHKPDKVKRETVFRNMKDGGLNMLNIRASILALKLTWIRRLVNGEGIWQNILLHRFKLDLMLNCGYEYLNFCHKSIKNMFWKDVFFAWSEMAKKEELLDDGDEALLLGTQPLWYNGLLKIDNKPIFYNSMYCNGFRVINDLLKDNGELYTFNELTVLVNIPINILQYYGLTAAINRLYREKGVTDKTKTYGPHQPKLLKTILRKHKGSKDMYDILNCTKGRPANEQKWLRHFDYLNTVTWKKMYAQIHHYIKDPKLIWFQFRIFHHILTTNKGVGMIRAIFGPIPEMSLLITV